MTIEYRENQTFRDVKSDEVLPVVEVSAYEDCYLAAKEIDPDTLASFLITGHIIPELDINDVGARGVKLFWREEITNDKSLAGKFRWHS